MENGSINVLKKDINISVISTIIFSVCAVILAGMINKAIPYGNSVFMLISAAVIVSANRKVLPEKWPFQQGWKMPFGRFMAALGIIGAFNALIGAVSSGDADMFSVNNLIFLGIVTPLAEEIVFRGAVLNRLKSHGLIFAAVISSLLFGLYHLNPIQLVTGMALGLAFAYVSLNYSVIYTIILHFVNNCIFALIIPYIETKYNLTGIKMYSGLVLLVSGIACALATGSFKRVKEFVADNKGRSEKGCYKAFILNPIFIVSFAICIVAGTFLVYLIIKKAG